MLTFSYHRKSYASFYSICFIKLHKTYALYLYLFLGSLYNKHNAAINLYILTTK